MTNTKARRRHKPAEKRGRPRLSAAEHEGTESSSLRLSSAMWAELRATRDGRTLRAHAERILRAGLDALAWAAAVAVAFERWGSSMELAAARGFCHALLAGDLDRAARCAVWIYAPGEAFRTAQAEFNARTQGAVS